MFNILFLQCQNEKALPHMNMPLFVTDIKAIGCNFECICVANKKLEDLLVYIKGKRYDLIALDYIFPISFLNKLKKIFPKAKLIIGGSGFLDTFLKSEIDFAVIGAGRESFLRLTEALKNKSDLYEVPNLFLKIKKRNSILIDYSGKNLIFNLKKELFPYNPFLKWKYIGFEKVDRTFRSVTVIAEFGCPYRTKKLNRYYDMSSTAKFNKYIFTKRAEKRIKDLLRERMSGGCSFCTYNSYISLPVEETIDCLMDQIRFLQEKYGFENFSIGSENPFRFIIKLINRMLKENIRIGEIAIRSRVDWVNKNKIILLSIINLAKRNNFKFCLQQLGFESFIQRDLDIYNKGYRVTENFKVIKLMRRMKKLAPKIFRETGHGIIGINPWLTIQDLEDNLKLSKYSKWIEPWSLKSKLDLYDCCLPIYQKIKKEGLLIERKLNLDTYSFKDKNVERFFNMSEIIGLYLRNKYSEAKNSQRKYYEYKKILMQFQKDILMEIKK